MGGSYTLKIKSNSKWTVEKSNKNWSESFNYSQISESEQSVTFSVDVAQLAKDSSRGTAVLIFRFPDDSIKEIKFVQDDWGITLYVSQGQSLSNEIKKVRDKLNEGFFIDEIYIDGGDIDDHAPYTVRLVSISNVDNIREGFCHNCNKLTSLTLENIKQIGMDAFREHNLSNISIPASVTYIGDRAFFKTEKWIPYVTCYNPNPPVLGSEVFVSGIGVGELRIPMGSKPKYKANSLWSKQFSDYKEY